MQIHILALNQLATQLIRKSLIFLLTKKDYRPMKYANITSPDRNLASRALVDFLDTRFSPDWTPTKKSHFQADRT